MFNLYTPEGSHILIRGDIDIAYKAAEQLIAEGNSQVEIRPANAMGQPVYMAGHAKSTYLRDKRCKL